MTPEIVKLLVQSDDYVPFSAAMDFKITEESVKILAENEKDT